jgi:hypothetical protein
MFVALQRIGPRLTMLLTHCLAAPLAATTEWLWLGEGLGWKEILYAGIILGGVALALARITGRVSDDGISGSACSAVLDPRLAKDLAQSLAARPTRLRPMQAMRWMVELRLTNESSSDSL